LKYFISAETALNMKRNSSRGPATQMRAGEHPVAELEACTAKVQRLPPAPNLAIGLCLIAQLLSRSRRSGRL
jgi:hypothetical protein